MLKFIKKCKNFVLEIYKKNQEIWNYLITGGFGVVVSVASYELSRIIGFGIITSNIISWIIAVLFMYVTNKIIVFKSKCDNNKELIKEFFSFIVARLFTLFIETTVLYIGSDLLKINDIIVKIIAQIIIIILNYIFSKLLIFKKKLA